MFGDGVVFVPLAAVRDPGLVLSSIGQALGIRQIGGQTQDNQVNAVLTGRQLLMVLDNFEQVAEAAPDVAEMLLGCPELTVLATSRARLRIDGEREYPMAALTVPAIDQLPAFDHLIQFEAIRLFAERAQEVLPEFVLTEESAPLIADICQRLDGLPLAIELAAARSRVLPLAAMRLRLERRLPLLVGGGRDLPERQQTMAATIAWSYDLLPPEEQRFVRQVAVFVGGFTLEAAAAVTAPESDHEFDILDLVTSLVDKSLLRPMETTGGGPRYAMLETIREFAGEQLTASGEADAVRERHADWCLDFASSLDDPLEPPFSEPVAIDRLQAEHANLRAALFWLDSAGRVDDLTEFVLALTSFWYLAGYAPEGLGWLNRVLELHPDRSDMGRMKVLIFAGHAALELQDPATIALSEEGRLLAKAAGDIGSEGRATLLLGMYAEYTGNFAEAEPLLIAARTLYLQTDLWWYQLVTEYHFGVVALGQGDSARATALLDSVLAKARDRGDVLLQGWCRRYLALIAYDRGDASGLAASLRTVRQLDVNSTTLHHQWRDHLTIAAALATVVGESATAARLLGAATHEAYGLALPLPDGSYYRRMDETARQHLDADDYKMASDTGRRMARAELRTEIDRLLTAVDHLPVPAAATHDPTRLTPREREVLQLLVDGRSNREIADTLYIGHRTATTHVTNILAKFGVETRAAAVTWAFQHDLL